MVVGAGCVTCMGRTGSIAGLGGVDAAVCLREVVAELYIRARFAASFMHVGVVLFRQHARSPYRFKRMCVVVARSEYKSCLV